MVRDFLVIEVADASDKRMVIILLRPIDRFFLSFESAQFVVRMVFDHRRSDLGPSIAIGFMICVVSLTSILRKKERPNGLSFSTFYIRQEPVIWAWYPWA